MADSTTCNDVLLRIDCVDGERAVVLEDDGKVAYAYLLQEDQIVADVWLYNTVETPETVDWKDKTAMPFLNPKKFCTKTQMPRLRNTSQVECDWSQTGVKISVDGLLVAHLERGSKPGWSIGAAIAGPLAKPLEVT